MANPATNQDTTERDAPPDQSLDSGATLLGTDLHTIRKTRARLSRGDLPVEWPSQVVAVLALLATVAYYLDSLSVCFGES